MIQIKDINIKYQNEVISNASISVPDGKITSIIGESGSGKTSLLYMLGLLSSQTCQYEFDGVTIDLRDDKLCSSYRKNKIGYIFQDNNINDQLTIYDNIKYVALISGESIDSEKVKQLLQLVDVNIDPHSYPNKLSVGERQRIAIACAISKNPSVIIADEPTSSLDEKNANLVMKIFREFVNKDNRKVIIATHSREIYEQTDFVYQIQDKTVKLIKHDEQNKNETIIEDLNNTEENSEKNQKIFATQLQYVMNRSKKDKGRKRLVLLLLGVSIALTLLSSSFGISFSREQATLVNDIADKEVVVINNTVPQISTRKNADPFLAIESASLVSIDSIDGVEDVCPIYEFSAYGIGMNEIVETASIVVNHQNQYVQEYSFDEMNDATPYTVLPYFSWQNYDSKSIALDDSVVDGIYISESLARKLDMNQLSDTSLQFSACVPMALFKSTVNMESGSYPADFDIITQQTYNFPVKGILDESLTNRYSIMGDNVIYMSYELMHNAMISATKSYVSEDGYIPWSPSAVALNVIDLSLIDSIRGRITNINPNFAVIAPLQDSKNMIQITENARGAASLIAIIILIIIISSMFVVFLNQTEQRKYEIAMLRANGYRRSEVVTLFLIEALFDALRVSIVAFSFATATNMILLFLFKNQMFDFDVTGFLQTILLDIISISLPTFLSLFRINKYHPDRLMRT